MVVWIASYSRSGNTFFRIVLAHLFNVNTYAAFQAGEVLVYAGVDHLVGHRKIPEALRLAIASRQEDEIRAALDNLDEAEHFYFFKTHAAADQLFGTQYRAILIVRDGRDAIASFSNYFVDIPVDSRFIHWTWQQLRRTHSLRSLQRLWKALLVSLAKRVGLRRWLVSRELQRILRVEDSTYLNWSAMNRSWLERDPKPVIVYYEDLVRDPIGSVHSAVEKLGLRLTPKEGVSIPSFQELNKLYPSFFREGGSGGWSKHFTRRAERLFQEKHREMMIRLGFRLVLPGQVLSSARADREPTVGTKPNEIKRDCGMS